MSDTSLRGMALEQRVAGFLRSQGYDARTNVILEGRSGGRHEIDVLAEKADTLTTFRIAVECKAWNQPIEKDVVSKLAYVMSDLGLHKGIVASLHGWRSGAAQAAKELGIEMWGPNELTTYLGQIALADLNVGPLRQLALGFPLLVDAGRARVQIDKHARGRLGIGSEEIVWIAPIWLPISVVTIALTTFEGRIKKVPRTRRVWNGYELVSEQFLWQWTTPQALSEIDLGRTAIHAAVKESQPIRTINEAYRKYQSVSTPSARERHADRLRSLGIPIVNAIATEESRLLYAPFVAAMLQRGGGERIVAIDGRSGEHNALVSTALSRNVHWLRGSLTP